MSSHRPELFIGEQAVTPLQDLFDLTGIPTGVNLTDAITATQKNWLRKPGQERWHIRGTNQTLSNTNIFASAFAELNMLDAQVPQHEHYEYAILLGATLHRVRSRLAYLLSLHDQGIQFDKLIVLGGQRPLDPGVGETPENMLQENGGLTIKKEWHAPSTMPTNESTMMLLVLDQTELPFSAENIIFIDTPMIQNADGTTRRPTTGDTFASWLKTNPQPGRCLSVSNQPYVHYQDVVARTYLPHSFEIETVGESTTFDPQEIPILLDTVARWLYQTQQLLKK